MPHTRDPRPLCLFCFWTHVAPGSNCRKCNTYHPKETVLTPEPKLAFKIRPEQRRKTAPVLVPEED